MANYLTQQDVDDYGRDLLDVSQRAALNAVSPYLQQTEGRLQQLQRDNADLRARHAREQRYRLDQQVASLVPDYQQVDADPRWHQWLLGTDLMSGRVRQALLNEAIRNGNAAQVKSIFDGYRQEGHSGSSSRASGRRSPTTKPTYNRKHTRRTSAL
jgi:hypothetical protein